MPRRNPILYSVDYTQQVKRIIDRYNKKARKNRGLYGQPNTTNYTLFLEKVQGKTKREANQELAKLERYLRKDAEQIVKTKGGAITSKYELYEIQLAVKRENRVKEKLREQYAKLNVAPEHTQEFRENLLPKKNVSQLVQGQERFNVWRDKALKNGEKTADTYLNRYKVNYLMAFDKEIGDEKLRKRIEALSSTELFELYYTRIGMEIEFVYALSIERDSKIAEIERTIDEFERKRKK